MSLVITVFVLTMIASALQFTSMFYGMKVLWTWMVVIYGSGLHFMLVILMVVVLMIWMIWQVTILFYLINLAAKIRPELQNFKIALTFFKKELKLMFYNYMNDPLYQRLKGLFLVLLTFRLLQIIMMFWHVFLLIVCFFHTLISFCLFFGLYLSYKDGEFSWEEAMIVAFLILLYTLFGFYVVLLLWPFELWK